MRQKRAAQEPIAAEGRLVVVMVVSCRRLRFKGTTLHVNCHFSSPLGPLSLRSLVLPVDVVDEIKRLLFDVKLNGFREVLKHELARLNNMLWLGIVVALLQDTKGISKYVRGLISQLARTCNFGKCGSQEPQTHKQFNKRV